MNWLGRKKLFVTFEIRLLNFSVYIGSAIYFVGTESVTQQFGVSTVAATLGLTLFVAGYGTGPMVWAPMSDIPQIGRNSVYIGKLVVFDLLQYTIIYAKNFGMLLDFRFLRGFFGSPVLATGGASIGDIYAPNKRAYVISIWGATAVCGCWRCFQDLQSFVLCLGGHEGPRCFFVVRSLYQIGYLPGSSSPQCTHANCILLWSRHGPPNRWLRNRSQGWTSTIWELMWLSGSCLTILIIYFPETGFANILCRCSRRLRKLTGDEKLKCEPEIESEDLAGKDILLMTFVRPFSLTLFEPIVLCMNLYIALVYGLLYVWFEPFVIASSSASTASRSARKVSLSLASPSTPS
jgi:MFS transporter, DHA1 family, multidrug resistance protein